MRTIALPAVGAAPSATDLTVRDPGPGELLVRVAASSVNGFDVAVVDGWIGSLMELRFPVVLGKDFAGTVEATGPDVAGFAVGDRVFGVVMTPYLGSDGGFAEYVVVGEGYGVARVPDGVDLGTAGALGLAGSAAVTALDVLALRPGQVLLVVGASGGVGSIAVQYAVAAGVRVLATALPGEPTAFLHGLGVDRVLPWAPELDDQVRALAPGGVDAVLHLADDAARLVGLLAPGGRLASLLMFGAEQHPAAVSVIANPDRATLDRLAADVAAGRLRVPVTRTYALADVPTALAEFRQGTYGKHGVRMT